MAKCQIGVFLAYASAKGRTFLDRELDLPQAWAEGRARRHAAGVPEEGPFATKLQLAQRMLAHAVRHRVPGRWVAGDAVYGGDSALRQGLEDPQLFSVLAVTAQYRLWSGAAREWAAPLINRLPRRAWRPCRVRWGSKGAPCFPRAHARSRQADTRRQDDNDRRTAQ
jgi:SRSO17 transposase